MIAVPAAPRAPAALPASAVFAGGGSALYQAACAGWPRGTRVHSQPDLLEYITAQKSLNYPVGDFYSYTNSGFLLLRTVIERGLVMEMPETWEEHG